MLVCTSRAFLPWPRLYCEYSHMCSIWRTGTNAVWKVIISHQEAPEPASSTIWAYGELLHLYYDEISRQNGIFWINILWRYVFCFHWVLSFIIIYSLTSEKAHPHTIQKHFHKWKCVTFNWNINVALNLGKSDSLQILKSKMHFKPLKELKPAMHVCCNAHVLQCMCAAMHMCWWYLWQCFSSLFWE